MKFAPGFHIRRHAFIVFVATATVAGAAILPAQAQNADSAAATATAPKGLWLTTPFPEFATQAGKKVDLDVKLVNNGLPAQRVQLAVNDLPDGWKWEIVGDSHDVAAAIAQTGQTVDLKLSVTPPADAAKKDYAFTIAADTGERVLSLPVTLQIAEVKPAELTLKPDLPALRGSAKSAFEFQVKASNDGQADTVVNLLSKAPAGFQVTFKEAYGSQELTSLPLDAGKSKSLKVSVRPPEDVAAGQYPVLIAAAGDEAKATQQLVLDITGQPTLELAGPDGRVSGDATAGKERTFNFTLKNSGTAAAEGIGFSANSPQDWKVTFSPDKIAEIAPGQSEQVAVSITPSTRSIAGDYVVQVRSHGEGVSDNSNFRVTVSTSTIWGVAGLGVIAAAFVVLGFSVSRYGRR